MKKTLTGSAIAAAVVSLSSVALPSLAQAADHGARVHAGDKHECSGGGGCKAHKDGKDGKDGKGDKHECSAQPKS